MANMETTANPLRRSKPSKDQSILHGRFYFTDEKGRLASGVGTHVYLTAESLWITPELSIAVERIESSRVVEKRGLPPRRFLEIRYVNPITCGREVVYLCKLDGIGIGLQRAKPVQELAREIETLRSHRTPSFAVDAEVVGGGVPEAHPALDRCETCGAKPAYYVSYLFLVSALLLSYRSESKRRVHCRKHNAIHGLAYYLLTALTGWIGIGIFAYPFVVFAAGRNLTPSFGKTSYVLGVLPPIALVVAIASWLL
jgi:hypothetical protein